MITHWHQSVLQSEGLVDWQIEDGEAYCWLSLKTIKIPKNCSDALFLHEVAHALYPYPEGNLNNHYHGGVWASEYERLVAKYLRRLQ